MRYYVEFYGAISAGFLVDANSNEQALNEARIVFVRELERAITEKSYVMSVVDKDQQ